MDYPIGFDVDYAEGERSRWWAFTGAIFFLKGVFLIPHAFILFFLQIAAMFAGWIGYWFIAITGRLPTGLYGFILGVIAWQNRTTAWLYGNVDKYPQFSFDEGDYPAQMTAVPADQLDEAGASRSRAWAILGIFLLKPLAALPHIIILWLLSYVVFVLVWISYWIVIVTGRLPWWLHDFYVGAIRWNARVVAWTASLEDRYPPFSLSS